MLFRSSFQLAWTSPPGYAISNPANGGFKRMSCHMNIGKTCTITRVSTTATVSCTAHGFSTGDSVIIAGATPSGYNGTYTVTVVDANTFTYTCSGALATPATGNIYCAFAGDWTGNGNPWDGGKWDFGNPSWDLSTDYVPPGMSADRVTPGQLYLNVRFKTTTPFSGGQVLFYKMWTSWKNTEFVGYFPSNVASLTL